MMQGDRKKSTMNNIIKSSGEREAWQYRAFAGQIKKMTIKMENLFL